MSESGAETAPALENGHELESKTTARGPAPDLPMRPPPPPLPVLPHSHSEEHQRPRSPSSPRRPRSFVLLALCLTNLGITGMPTAMAPLFPLIAQQRTGGDNQANLKLWVACVFAIFSIAELIAVVIFGRTVPRCGPKMALLISIVLGGLATIAVGCSALLPVNGTPYTFYAVCMCARFVQGMSVSLGRVACRSLALRLEAMGLRASGLVEQLGVMGQIMGPPFAGLIYWVCSVAELQDSTRFAVPFIVLGCAPMPIAVLVVRTIPEDASTSSRLKSISAVSHGGNAPIPCGRLLKMGWEIWIISLASVFALASISFQEPTLTLFLQHSVADFKSRFNQGQLAVVMGCIFAISAFAYALAAPMVVFCTRRSSTSRPLILVGLLIVYLGLIMMCDTALMKAIPRFLDWVEDTNRGVEQHLTNVWTIIAGIVLIATGAALAQLPAVPDMISTARRNGFSKFQAQMSIHGYLVVLTPIGQTLGYLWGGAVNNKYDYAIVGQSFTCGAALCMVLVGWLAAVTHCGILRGS